MASFPIVEEIPFYSPVEVVNVLPHEGLLFLDSANSSTQQGRYSFVAFSPFQTLSCKNNEVTLAQKRYYDDPFLVLKKESEQFSLPFHDHFPPFQGGIAGMFGYELGGYLEKLPRSLVDDLEFPEMLVGFYDLVIAWDHQLMQSWVFSSGYPEQRDPNRLERAIARRDWALTLINQKTPKLSFETELVKKENILSPFTQESYEQSVKKVIEYIRAGDIFEVNISQRFSTKWTKKVNAWALYCKLRKNNPAPFAAFMQHGEYKIASASPERFLKLRDRKVETRPIKGTRRRDLCPIQDNILAQELKQSEKDQAENIMIVDLMRNDLSRVCKPHTVLTPQLCGLESFATVHHLVSVVEGELMPDKNALDLLSATFPGGSITGAPKIRAMEIIAELEPTLRGPYCGSMGYIGFNGDMDLSITIRTYVIKDNQVTFQVGGAITVDSSPAEEYEETLTKAQMLFATLIR